MITVKAIQLVGTVPQFVTMMIDGFGKKRKQKLLDLIEPHTLTGSARISLIRRMAAATANSHFALDNEDQDPMRNYNFRYALIPASAEVQPTLDMAFLTAMYFMQFGVTVPKNFACCGEVMPSGEFVPLQSPLAVGKLALELDIELVVPDCNAEQIAMTGAKVLGMKHVSDFMRSDHTYRKSPDNYSYVKPEIDPWADLKFVKGQENAKLALEISVAGGHNLLLVGPPGEAKSEIAKRSYTIAPLMTLAEAIDVTWMHQVARRVNGDKLITTRPFNMATKDTSPAGLQGGGDSEGPVPGLVSLSHNGILMADEVFEWSKTKIDALRIPLQDRSVSIVRKDWQVKYPANFQLIATANPCPCGFFGHPDIPCCCIPNERRRYVHNMSGPIMDRIDLKVWMPPLGEQIFEAADGETSRTIQKRVQKAADIQAKRYKDSPIQRNCELGPGYFEVFCNETAEALKAMATAQRENNLTSRGVSVLRKVSRTCADLQGANQVDTKHVVLASSFMELAILREAASSG